MKLTNTLLTLVVVLLAVIAVTLIVQSNPATVKGLTPDDVQKSEYFVVTERDLISENKEWMSLPTKVSITKSLNLYASQGFELVEIIPEDPPHSQDNLYFFVRENKDIYYKK